MSLLAWYPLEKDYKNYGLGGAEFNLTSTATFATPTFSNGGKTSSTCFTTNAPSTIDNTKVSNVHTAGSISLNNGKNFSIACWAKRTMNVSGQQWIFQVGGGDYTNNSTTAACGIGVFVDAANNLYLNNNGGMGNGYINGMELNQWYHIVLTLDESNTIYVYLNGVLKLTKNRVNPLISPSGLVFGSLYATSYYNFRGCIQDARFYDHVLSQEEIHNIYNSLIVHYPFNDPEETGLTNLYQNYKNGWRNSIAGFSATSMEENGYKFTRYTFTYTGTGTSNCFFWKYPIFSFTAGKRYWYSCKVRVNSMSNTNVYFRSARMDNDWEGNAATLSASNVGKGWYTVSGYRDLQATSVRNGSTLTTNPLIEFYTSDLATKGTVFSASVDIRDVCVYECPYGSFVGYVDNTYMSRTIYDVSGHKNNGTLVGTSIIVPTTGLSGKLPINYSYYTGGNYARIDYQAGKVTDEITVAVWAHRDNWDSGDYRLLSCTEGGGWNFERTNDTNGLRWIVYATGDYRRCTGVTGITSGWHHFVGTWDGKQAKYYIDGVLKSSSTALSSKTPITYHTGNYVIIGAEAGTSNTAAGSTSTEFLNDLRIYASALSADDVRQLYSVRGKIDNLGNVYDFGYSYDNANPDPKFTANGRCIAGQHKEIDYPYPYGTNSALRTEPDGSVWMKIFHHNNPASKLFAQTDPFTTRFVKDDDRWADFSIFDQLTSFEIMGIICATSGGTTYKYRWIQPVNPLTATWAQVAVANITNITTSGYTNGIYGGLWKKNGATYLCQNNGAESNWWGAVGAWNQHAGGIPGLNKIVVTTGYEDLYVRIDGGRLKRPSKISANIGKGGLRSSFITANNFYEI